jgi:hypothetical protein
LAVGILNESRLEVGGSPLPHTVGVRSQGFRDRVVFSWGYVRPGPSAEMKTLPIRVMLAHGNDCIIQGDGLIATYSTVYMEIVERKQVICGILEGFSP